MFPKKRDNNRNMMKLFGKKKQSFTIYRYLKASTVNENTNDFY